jgi:hypothetical protein
VYLVASNRAGTGSASVTVHRGRSGAGAFHRDGEVGTDGMRGDGVGVGDVGAVPGGAWCSGHASGDGDGGRARAAACRRGTRWMRGA